jgi:hypothetical protein
VSQPDTLTTVRSGEDGVAEIETFLNEIPSQDMTDKFNTLLNKLNISFNVMTLMSHLEARTCIVLDKFVTVTLHVLIVSHRVNFFQLLIYFLILPISIRALTD